jgi:hypothetical protein
MGWKSRFWDLGKHEHKGQNQVVGTIQFHLGDAWWML